MAEILVPLTVPVALAGALFGVSRPTAYRLRLPLLDLPGRKRVAVADLERLLGTKITADHIAQAEAKLEQKSTAHTRQDVDYPTTKVDRRAREYDATGNPATEKSNVRKRRGIG